MKLYLYFISQEENTGYDTYDSAVVCAESEEQARNINPNRWKFGNETGFMDWSKRNYDWCSSPDKVTVEYIGEAKEGSEIGVILSSFNAG